MMNLDALQLTKSTVRRFWASLMTVLCITAFHSAAAVAIAHGPTGASTQPESTGKLKATLALQHLDTRPGETVGLAIIMDVQSNWHVYPGKGSPDEMTGYIATEISLNLPTGWTAGPIQWPDAHDYPFGFGDYQEIIQAYANQAIAYVPLTVPESGAAGKFTISATVDYQACDDTICDMPDKTTAEIAGTVIEPEADIAAPTDGITNIFSEYVPPTANDLAGINTFEGDPDYAVNKDAERVTFTLDWQRPQLVAGDQVGLAINLDISDTWHVNPGEGSGDEHDFPTTLDFKLPVGWKVSRVQWPHSHEILGPLGEEMIKVYAEQPIAFVGLTVPADAAPGEYTVGVGMQYQACDPNLCEPPNAAIATAQIRVVDVLAGSKVESASATTIDRFNDFDPAAAFTDDTTEPTEGSLDAEDDSAGINMASLRWYGVFTFITIAMLFMMVRTFMITPRIGMRIFVAVVGLGMIAGSFSFVRSSTAHAEGWESFTQDTFDEARAQGDIVVLDFTAEWCLNCKTVERVALSRPEFAEAVGRDGVTAFIADITTGQEEAKAYKDSIPELGGGIPILAVYHPGAEKPVILQGLYGLDAALDVVLGNSAAFATDGHVFDFLGWRFSVGQDAWVIVLGLALIAGMLLNFTPCVLPVLPIKILSLQAHAKNPTRCFFLGLVFGAGIVAMFAVLGLIMGGLVAKLSWGEFFQYWWANLLLGVIILGMGIGMLGAFTTNLPNWVYMFNPQSDSAKGSFFLGVLTAVLSTPCAGPLLGAALVWAATQPAWLALMMFIIMGVGMALPYVILTANPKWIDRLPRTGPGSELVKQVMGLLMIAAAIFFLGTVPLTFGNTAQAGASNQTTTSDESKEQDGMESENESLTEDVNESSDDH